MRKGLFKSIVFSVVFISCLNQQIASAAVYKTIRVVTTKTLYNAFGGSETTKNYASAKINDLKYSFAEFGISFTPTFSIITYNDFPSDDCPLSPLSICKSSCASALTARHKYYIKNLNWLSNNYSFQNNNFLLAIQGNVFNSGILGVTEFVGGNRVVIACPSNQSAILDSRILQHEMSHVYGMYDGGCTGKCVMSGGFDKTPISQQRNIWCSYHYNQFRPR